MSSFTRWISRIFSLQTKRFDFSDATRLKDQSGSILLKEHTVLMGEGDVTITLFSGVQVEIAGKYRGLIMGQGNNVVQISGEFIGEIETAILSATKGSYTEGSVSAQKWLVEAGAKMKIDGEMNR